MRRTSLRLVVLAGMMSAGGSLAAQTANPWASGFVAAAGAESKHAASKTIVVAAAPDAAAKEQLFADKRDGVSFRVPPGWELQRKDGQVSTFHGDARSAPGSARLKAVAQIDFNPYPRSTFAGAFFYFSVEKKMSDVECERQATAPVAEGSRPVSHKDTLPIGDLAFSHGHDEHGGICTEARDEVYTGYRRHVCYRFDLAINTFCAISSGAQEITDDQLKAIHQRMADILSTVVFTWQTPAAAAALPAAKN